MGRLFGGVGMVFCPRFHIGKKSEDKKPSEIFLAGENFTSPRTPVALLKNENVQMLGGLLQKELWEADVFYD